MNILKKPIVSEKATSMNELVIVFLLLLIQELTRFKSKKLVESSYNVTVLKVRTMIYGPVRKTKYTKTGMQKSKSVSFKKAIVQVS